MPSPCRTPSVRPPASDRRPQGGHPCIERTRDAQGRSNALRPPQRRFKARKKPDGYTSTPTGLKRLKTQNTASRGNENGKGTPSGVPQPIHKRKLVLVKEEFDASSSGGDEGNRTPVRKNLAKGFSERSWCFKSPSVHRPSTGYALWQLLSCDRGRSTPLFTFTSNRRPLHSRGTLCRNEQHSGC